ncbi:hypothetical protein M422DRAFT_253681 [Sphaerobolus stellatus SS14]|uniref:CCHC-type domain-containing protein n=1 Tax=Sphaerobolus stellatus (strain SS14) TaxID=990650 RepID=A0A0C9V826_SPHS4|nr:hypothetical protein M422DRAFT_253681 [Sphaerobolus stellatus SS14]
MSITPRKKWKVGLEAVDSAWEVSTWVVATHWWYGVGTTDLASAFNDLEAWIQVVQKVVNVRETSKVFEENLRVVEEPAPSGPKPLSVIPRMLPTAPPIRTFNYQAQLLIPVVNAQPIDVDGTHSKASISNIVCRPCDKTGHIARFCETTFDIQSLMVEEKEELLYELMADLDMSDASGAELFSEEEVISK